MRLIRLSLLLAATSIFFLTCKKETVDNNNTTGQTGSDSTATDDGFVTNTRDTSFANAVLIQFDGDSASVTNPFSASGVTAAVTDGDVVITSTTTSTEINYVLSGKATKGSLKLYSDYKFGLILNGVSIINDNGPAINVQSSKKVSVNVLGSTNNRLIDGSTYASSTEDQKGTFFSEGQLVFSGSGALSVTGNYKHAICSDDYISITDGNITVAKAASDGIHANDYIKMDAGTVTITASGDGIECEEGYIALNGGTIAVTSVDDGITASYDGTDASITPYVQIKGGTINITTTGEKGNAISSESYTSINDASPISLTVSGRAAKGFKTGGDFTLTNGNITIVTSGNAFYDTDDADITAAAGINCDGNLSLVDGSLSITGTGTAGKGITVDGSATISGGTINIIVSGSSFTYGSLSSEAKGIKADGALTITGGSINISATDDGIKSETSINSSAAIITISKSYEGIEAPYITLSSGTVTVTSSDDCLNATNGNGGESNDGSLLTLAGATVYLNSTGGDPMDSNGSIEMTGGTVVVQGPASSPEVAIDYNGSFLISGGLLIASGPNSGNMIQGTSTSSEQYTALIRLTGNISANTLITIQDAAGTNLVTYAPNKSAYYLVFSSASLTSGASYKLYTGGSYTGTAVNGLYTGGTYSPGTLRGSFTISSKLTSVTL